MRRSAGKIEDLFGPLYFNSLKKHGLFPLSVAPLRFLDAINTSLVPVTRIDLGFRTRPSCMSQLSHCRVNHPSLKTLPQAPQSAGLQAMVPARIGLVNARSLGN